MGQSTFNCCVSITCRNNASLAVQSEANAQLADCSTENYVLADSVKWSKVFRKVPKLSAYPSSQSNVIWVAIWKRSCSRYCSLTVPISCRESWDIFPALLSVPVSTTACLVTLAKQLPFLCYHFIFDIMIPISAVPSFGIFKWKVAEKKWANFNENPKHFCSTF